jgi:hypothetical protein
LATEGSVAEEKEGQEQDHDIKSQQRMTPKKKRMIVIKGQQLTKQDYRGLLALFLVASFVYSVLSGASDVAIASLGPFTGSAVGYYFQAMRIEKHPSVADFTDY